MDMLDTITELSHEFGGEAYVKGGGGNTSCKDGDTLWIKPSGTTLSTLSPETFVAMDRGRMAALYEATPPDDATAREAMVKDLMTRFQGHVFATGRNPNEAVELQQLMQTFPGRITPVPLDVTNEGSVIAAAARIRENSQGRVDIVVNTAGILHDVSEPSSQGRMPERQLKDISEEWLMYNFKVNTMNDFDVTIPFYGIFQSDT